MRILLVEDDVDLSRQLKLALGDAGYAVDHAADGEEAPFLGDTEPYDVVVLDLGLPKIDGVSVLERWRRDGKTTPVLILTARGAATPFGVTPRIKSYPVVAIFQIGVSEFDGIFVFMPFEEAQAAFAVLSQSDGDLKYNGVITLNKLEAACKKFEVLLGRLCAS